MLRLKFLAEGAMGPYSKFAWPKPTAEGPGEWVMAEDSISPCARGIHACAPDGLSLWLAAELWVVELEGRIVSDRHKIVAEHGRLVRRVEGWDRAMLGAFGQAAIMRARDLVCERLRASGDEDLAAALGQATDAEAIAEVLGGRRGGVEGAELALGYLADAIGFLKQEPVVAAFCAAHTALDEQGYWQERAWQSRWIVERLGLGEWVAGDCV